MPKTKNPEAWLQGSSAYKFPADAYGALLISIPMATIRLMPGIVSAGRAKSNTGNHIVAW